MKLSAKLTRLYKRYNRRYFGNRCPREITLIGYTKRQRPRSELGYYISAGGTVQFRTSKGPRITYRGPVIMLRVDEPEMVIYQTLLHEMCHVVAGMDHGPRWQREMLRLANEGAFKNIW